MGAALAVNVAVHGLYEALAVAREEDDEHEEAYDRESVFVMSRIRYNRIVHTSCAESRVDSM
jgi:hypothetical protein